MLRQFLTFKKLIFSRVCIIACLFFILKVTIPVFFQIHNHVHYSVFLLLLFTVNLKLKLTLCLQAQLSTIIDVSMPMFISFHKCKQLFWFFANLFLKKLTTQLIPNLCPGNSATRCFSWASHIRTMGRWPHSPVTWKKKKKVEFLITKNLKFSLKKT